MRCQEIQSWTGSELVGAFLDLSITYLLLCASTLAYLASKFLGLFGLCLPCPCNGLFSDPNRNKCWQRMLVDYPFEFVSSVQYSVKNRFPFDSLWDSDSNSQLSMGFVDDSNHENGLVGLEGEEACCSFQDRRDNGVGSGLMHLEDSKEGSFDVKEKRGSNQKAKNYLRRWRKIVVDNGRFSSVLLDDPLQSDEHALPQSPASVSKIVSDSNEGSMVPVSSDGGESSMGIGLPGRMSCVFEVNESVNENKPKDKHASPADDLRCKMQGELCLDGDKKNKIRILEQALEEEHAARDALCLELEKERSAAATAAAEAMAMILRLQEEKALIDMEARQYHRIIEAKSAYDFEEMNVLKEILLRREREKHFLEKEVEAYRKMIFRSEQLDSGLQEQDIVTIHGKRASSFWYSHEDPALMLQKINESIFGKEKLENANKFSDCEVRSIESQNYTLAFGKELPIPELDEVDFLKQGSIHRQPSIDKFHQHLSCSNEEIKVTLEEKELVSMDNSPFDQEREALRLDVYSHFKLSTAQEYSSHEETRATVGEVQQQSASQGLASKATENRVSKTTETRDQTKIAFPNNCDNSEKNEKDSYGAAYDIGPCIHDVHMITDKFIMCNGVGEDGTEKLSGNAAFNIPTTCDSPTMNKFGTEQDISRSSSDITSGLPPQSMPLFSNLRRNSMSAVDYERFKIDNEVGWLRERLRIVQERREKLNISMGHREKEKIQLQLLENKVSQLQETWQLTEYGKCVWQALLPPPSCKVTPNKRCWRSVSLEVHRST